MILRVWFIFKDKMHLKIWFDALKNVEDVEEAKKSHIAVNDNEWISNEIDLDWLQKCFESESAKWQQEKFHLLIIDEHAFHLTSEAIMFCKKNHIILLCLSSHSIDLLQSLNVEVFLSLIIIYKLKLEAFTRLSAEYSIDKLNFIKLYLQARKIALTTSNIQSAWIKSDLAFLNHTIVLSKLSIVIKPRSITSSDITIQSSSDVSFSISFISFNVIEMNMLMK